MIGTPLIVLPIMFPAVAGTHPGVLLLPVVAAILLGLLFGTLTVVVDEERLSLRFGVGLIRKSIPLSGVRSFGSVRNPWYYGWGIRFTPRGTLYNVSGLSAIALLLKNGKHVRVGTDEPEALERALRGVLGEPLPLSLEEQQAAGAAARRLAVFAGIFGVTVAVIVLGLLYVGLQQPRVDVSPEAFSVSGGGFYRVHIPIGDIVEVSLQDTIPRVVRKTNGFNAGTTLRGHFRLEVLGDGQMFVNYGVPPYVVIKTRESFVIVNFEDPERTRALYASLKQYAGAR